MSKRLLLIFLVVATGAAVPARALLQQPAGPPADTVLLNGKIVTVEDSLPEAQAIAIVGDRIADIGSGEDMKRHVGQKTQVIDLKGQLVIPGFVEGHGHFSGVGQAKLNLNLMDTTSWDEIVAMVGEAAKTAKPGEWILGRGWHQEKWTSTPQPNVEGFPTHESLSRVSPDNPVFLRHASGHASFANAKAMELSGVTGKSPDPPGGDLLKDANGNPTGLFRETASRLIKVPEGDPSRARKALELASQEVLSKGVTSFQDAGSTTSDVDLMKQMIEEGAINVRLWVMLRMSNRDLAANLAKYRMVDYANGFLTVRGIKKSIDGALGPRGAWLLEPYADKPGDTGHNTTPVEEIREAAKLAVEHGYQMCVHAIGDRANRETLNIFEEFYKANAGKDLRWRVEHAQHLHPADIPRFGALGVIASMQGVHCTSDAPYVPARLGDKRAEEGAYVWQKLMKSGATVSNGTDAPVEDVDPIASFYSSVSRRTKDGTVFYPDQRMSRLEALKSYTINGAYAAFEENSRGSLKKGKYADLVVLSKDIMTVPEEEIPSAQVLYTIVGGKIRYRK